MSIFASNIATHMHTCAHNAQKKKTTDATNTSLAGKQCPLVTPRCKLDHVNTMNRFLCKLPPPGDARLVSSTIKKKKKETGHFCNLYMSVHVCVQRANTSAMVAGQTLFSDDPVAGRCRLCFPLGACVNQPQNRAHISVCRSVRQHSSLLASPACS